MGPWWSRPTHTFLPQKGLFCPDRVRPHSKRVSGLQIRAWMRLHSLYPGDRGIPAARAARPAARFVRRGGRSKDPTVIGRSYGPKSMAGAAKTGARQVRRALRAESTKVGRRSSWRPREKGPPLAGGPSPLDQHVDFGNATAGKDDLVTANVQKMQIAAERVALPEELGPASRQRKWMRSSGRWSMAQRPRLECGI
jgi:hypothetical protein